MNEALDDIFHLTSHTQAVLCLDFYLVSGVGLRLACNFKLKNTFPTFIYILKNSLSTTRHILFFVGLGGGSVNFGLNAFCASVKRQKKGDCKGALSSSRQRSLLSMSYIQCFDQERNIGKVQS